MVPTITIHFKKNPGLSKDFIQIGVHEKYLNFLYL